MTKAVRPPKLSLPGASWPGLLDSPDRAALERLLPAYLGARRWFGGKARKVRRMRVSGHFKITENAVLSFIEVLYAQGPAQTYILPLGWRGGKAAAGISAIPGAALADAELAGGRGIIYDAVHDEEFRAAFLALFSENRRFRSGGDSLESEKGPAAPKAAAARLKSRVIKAEQSNTSIIYGSRYFAKLFRRLEEGVNPDIEIGRRLARAGGFSATPRFLGALTLRRSGLPGGAIGLLQSYSANKGDSWSYALEQVSGYYRKVLSRAPRTGSPSPSAAEGLIGRRFLRMAALLGRRTAQMHLALCSAGGDRDFSPEKFTPSYRRHLSGSMLSLTDSTFGLLSRKMRMIPALTRVDAAAALARLPAINAALRGIGEDRAAGRKIRVHGDYHLGQVLFTGKDFIIIDFEGEPARPLEQRRAKRSALCDVAGMLRSFHYAAWAPFFLDGRTGTWEAKTLAPWAEAWYSRVSDVFLASYLKTAGAAAFLPGDGAATRELLKIFLLEKAVYELGYELNNRPDWVAIPLKGILSIA